MRGGVARPRANLLRSSGQLCADRRRNPPSIDCFAAGIRHNDRSVGRYRGWFGDVDGEMSMKWLRRVTSSLFGVVAMSQVGFSLPLCIFFLHQDYLDDNLTKSQVILEIGVWLIGGVVMGVLLWYTVSLPLLKKLEKKRQR
jgi:hypothetical protein